MLHRLQPREGPLGNRDHVVKLGIRRVGDRQLDVAVALREILGLPLVEPQLVLVLPEPGEELADDQEDEAGVASQMPTFRQVSLKR